jgi:error-prone DNA polymerase
VHPNLSRWDAVMEGVMTARMGFRDLEGANEEDVKDMIEKRKQQEFKNTEDFISRTSFKKNVITTMAMANIFSCFGTDRRHSFWDSLDFHPLSESSHAIQPSLFDQAVPHQNSKGVFRDMTLLEEITWDYKTIGYSLLGNIMKGIRQENSSLPPLRTTDIRKFKKGRVFEFAGVKSVLQRPPPAKGTAFLTMEDDEGSLDFIIPKHIYERFSSIIENYHFYIIQGRVQVEGKAFTIIVKGIKTFQKQKSKPSSPGPSPRQLNHSLGW